MVLYSLIPQRSDKTPKTSDLANSNTLWLYFSASHLPHIFILALSRCERVTINVVQTLTCGRGVVQYLHTTATLETRI